VTVQRVVTAALVALFAGIVWLLILWKSDDSGVAFWVFMRDPRPGKRIAIVSFGIVLLAIFVASLVYG